MNKRHCLESIYTISNYLITGDPNTISGKKGELSNLTIKNSMGQIFI